MVFIVSLVFFFFNNCYTDISVHLHMAIKFFYQHHSLQNTLSYTASNGSAMLSFKGGALAFSKACSCRHVYEQLLP